MKSPVRRSDRPGTVKSSPQECHASETSFWPLKDTRNRNESRGVGPYQGFDPTCPHVGSLSLSPENVSLA
ncbi:hypothetical protein GWI33_005777 [Rhynchophorus ferrugineus]|uniref:Uncharacterized protein n=1 Tax=Rhynchophorus ferrugineus TaxID=354439 RepID=A0A834IGX3_RHYFE|nr:hypothetical protein GWI33_005777 [Rhynchophorus ferrugineus]